MTGGFAYVLDQDNTFVDRVNHELVEIQRISGEAMESHRNHLQHVLDEYVEETGSEWGRNLAENLDDFPASFLAGQAQGCQPEIVAFQHPCQPAVICA